MRQAALIRTAVLGLLVMASTLMPHVVHAGAPLPENPQQGSIGLEGKVSTDPPRQGATITSPGNGATFGSVPITVTGLCPNGLLVKIFSNNVFVGAVQCEGGSYSVQVDLFTGQNQLVARVFDALDQPGPDSNVVTVTFNDPQFIQFGTRVSLSSIFAKRGANPGEVLVWPIILSGGTGPYAISIDWGDGTPPDLMSQPTAGNIDIRHTYKSAGVYKVLIKATDANGTTAYLQLVGVANGKVGQSAAAGAGGNSQTVIKEIIWWPAAAMLPLIGATFWVGRRHELYTLRKQLEKQRSAQ